MRPSSAGSAPGLAIALTAAVLAGVMIWAVRRHRRTRALAED
jgi:hypothetical protein